MFLFNNNPSEKILRVVKLKQIKKKSESSLEEFQEPINRSPKSTSVSASCAISSGSIPLASSGDKPAAILLISSKVVPGGCVLSELGSGGLITPCGKIVSGIFWYFSIF